MSQMQLSPSDDELNHAPPPSAGPRTTSPADTASEPHVLSRGRRSVQTTPRTPRRRGLPLPPPARTPASSPASSYRSAVPTIPPIGKWTVLSLRQALINSDIQPSRRMTKAQLYNLFQGGQQAGKFSRGPEFASPDSATFPCKVGLPRASARGARISASLGRAPDSTATRPRPPPASPQLFNTVLPAAAPYTAGPAGSHSASQFFPPAVSNPFPLQWPPAPVADASVRLPPLVVETQTFHHFPATTANPSPFQWPAAQASARPPPLATQAQASHPFPPFPPGAFLNFPSQTPQADLSVRLPPPIVAAQASLPYSYLLNAKSQYSLFTATPMPVPPNAVALEPPPVTQNIRAQILAEIQDAGSRGRQATNSSTSLFGINIPITHPQKSLLNISLDTILQAVSPRTLQSYVTAWGCFKAFHLSYNTPFPDFSLLTITSFISYLNSVKSLQVGSIKSYLSGIQFFHKLIHGAPSPEINNSQTSLLIKGIQRSQPTRPDTRQPITLDILTKCIHTLRSGYRSLNTSRTLDAMFILAFFGFLRCSELAITSRFDPKIHPNISDLSVLDSETISFLIKQSKTDQTKKGHFIYIFNLSSPIQPFQTILAYLQLRNSHAKFHLEPLFIDDSNKPVTRFWFQKHLKSVLQLSGIPAENFSSHSFRIGAATSAAQKGLSQQQIQALGRWSSDAFQTYIRTNRFHIKKAHQILIG
ncbi:uncharacterized protein LOC130076258 [Rhinichthys klamathensis goyatoka]|uniref:uncharacterized protein LOC130076258 n=1 Tax=Rhinichthys klamathensis goyatoka TaxID=3034132 RepID=UPI0024B6082C|nr:uncharacterized protein LOC130076258 [Rhinichthys klamathensis goyatoka]